MSQEISLKPISQKYRLAKTFLLIMAWASFGLNNEMIGSTLEDLKLYLNVNYQMISFNLVQRSIGNIIFVSFCGLFYDKFSKYSDLFMALSSLFLALPNLFIPITKTYWISSCLFLVQGIASAFYDLGGNHIIFSLWKGISNSPVNAMHAGYGLGALIAVQISKPFIKFDPLDKYRNATESNRTILTSDDIQLFVPYSIASAFAIILSVVFIIFQIYELRRYKETGAKKQDIIQKLEFLESQEKNGFFMKLLFGKRVYKGSSLYYMLSQIFLISLVLFCLQGYLTVLGKFMLTYLTKGPGKFSINDYTSIQTLFWLLFVLSRFLAAFIAFKMNSILFVFILFLANLITTSLFLVPYLCESKIFFWFSISLLGLVVGPSHPSMFMVAKQFVEEYNSFVMSIFSIGPGLSSILFQDLTGRFLDFFEPKSSFLGFENFESAYIIMHICFIPSFFCLILYIIIYILYKKMFNNNKK